MPRLNIIFGFLLFTRSLLASLILDIPCPQDNHKVKFAIWEDPKTKGEIEKDRKKIYETEEILRVQTESTLKACFGAATTTVPDGFVIPVARHSAVGFSGKGYNGDGKSYFLSIDDLGGVLIFPFGDRDFVSAVSLYLKTGSGFRLLSSAEDYPVRRKWDMNKIDLLRKRIEQKLKNRGQISLMDLRIDGKGVD